MVFQPVVLTGTLPGSLTWGGRLATDDERVAMIIVSLLALLVLVALVLQRWKSSNAMWCAAGLFLLNTLGNMASLDRRETISSVDGRIKGLLVNAYGPDASPLTQEMVRKLATHAKG